MANKVVLNEAFDACVPTFPQQATLQVLEAGCGSASYLRADFKRFLTGIDIDPEQLNAHTGLDRAILGDLQEETLPRGAFDLIVCVDVLEHLPRPLMALENMWAAARPGGSLIIACPERVSYKGFLARFTPLRLRHAIFRLLTGRSSRTLLRGGVVKTFFPTILHPICRHHALVRWARGHGAEVVYDRAYDTHTAGLAPLFKVVMIPLAAFSAVVKRVSGGRTDLLGADFCVAFRKPESPPP